MILGAVKLEPICFTVTRADDFFFEISGNKMDHFCTGEGVVFGANGFQRRTLVHKSDLLLLGSAKQILSLLGKPLGHCLRSFRRILNNPCSLELG